MLIYLYFIATFLKLLWRNLVLSDRPDFFVVVFPLMGFLNLLIEGMFKLTFIFPVYWLALSLFMVLARWASRTR